ncbi:MAG: hypothetical protein GTN49_03165, partial [candidate division Zixibacteria bacterium]|nr:hypothetical protein [candidate division Zixibacteria bacterium]
ALARVCEEDIKAAYQIAEKTVRQDRVAAIKKAATDELVGEEEGQIAPGTFGKLFKSLESRVVRTATLE